MARETGRREEVAQAATDYVLEHGLVDLSLRPLAAALGTSDRMLLYHFESKDDLIATVLRITTERFSSVITALPASVDVRHAVLDLWAAATSPRLDRCQRLYVEAAAIGLFGREPYAAVVREANEAWVRAVMGHLVASGMPVGRARRAVTLLDAAFTGFQLDLPLDAVDPALDQAVADLADAVVVIAGPVQGSA